ncbi:MAG: sigma-54-dependent Fis family transcriptional regulator [Candidatus Koribacter versatilis]|nr:sigma-54-dependent Fis family transcriptional regulator [Candidatus Koribacter versatilis]
MPNYADHILVASPSSVVRQRVLESLRSPARRVEQASGGAEALGHLENGLWQVLFLDRSLPDLNAEELSQTVRRRFPGIEVVLLDSESNAEAGVAEEDDAGAPATRLETPRQSEVCAAAIDSILQAPLPGMIGNSCNMQPVYRVARLLARRNTTVLLEGPTGCGKELVARAIHTLSPRAGRAFVVVNCAAIPEPLLESELFGHTRGAFTGAMQSYGGRIQTAQGGTLFLDEIGEMPLSLQPKLLRFLEQKELQRLGSCDVVRVDARVIAATNAHLPALVRQGKFREDLYYRLCAFPMEIPSLRERPEDIVQLAHHFLEKLVLRPPPPELSSAGTQWLQAQPWAGNVRELQNVIERALILAEDEAVIRLEHLRMPASLRS